MSLIPTVYKSTDPGAPALTGQVGSLVTLLRAALVDGYGSSPTAMAGAGWTETFTGTNKAVFRNNPTTGTGGYLRIDDGATVSGSNARYGLWRLYETMSDVDTGTGETPTVAQAAAGGLVLKSSALNSTARAWVILACERWFYLFVDLGNSGSGWVGVASFPSFFGDLMTRKPGDAYHFAGVSAQGGAFTGVGNYSGIFIGQLIGAVSPSGGYLLRDHLQTTASKAIGTLALSDGYTGGFLGAQGTYPDAISGGIAIERIGVLEGARLVRGYFPNVYGSIHGRAFADMATRTDLEGLPDGTELLVKRVSQSAPMSGTSGNFDGMLLFDISNEWADL